MPQTQSYSQLKPSVTVSQTVLIILFCLMFDQWTKLRAIDLFKYKAPRIYLNNFFRFEYAENTGAFLGLGATLGEPYKTLIFVILVGGFLLGLLYYLFFKPVDKISHYALTLIAAGGIGNLIDRIFRANHGVVDFMNMGIGSLRTGIFNVADVFIMIGVIVLFLLSLFTKQKAR